MIPIYKPYLPKESLKYAHDALDGGWISSANGKYLELVKNELKYDTGAKFVILTNTGTAATHLVARVLKKKYPEIHNIIVPSNVYVAAWNAFLFDKAFTLFPVDADIETWNMDLDMVESMYEPNTAILVTHNLGNITNVPELKKRFPDAVFVEDACEAFGGFYYNSLERIRHAGTASLAGSLSFYGNKNVTSGEGGAFLTDDPHLARFAFKTKGQGQRTNVKFVHNLLGYNYRMTNVQAAILYGQLQIVSEIFSRKEAIFSLYDELFNEVDNIVIQKVSPKTINSNWMYGIRIPGSPGFPVAERFMNTRGIDIRPMFYPINSHTYIAENRYVNTTRGPYRNSEKLSQECFCIPCYPELSLEDQIKVAEAVVSYSFSGKKDV